MTGPNDTPGRDGRGRFVKGSTGNRKGAPKKAAEPRSSIFDFVLTRTMAVKLNGETRDLTPEELSRFRTIQDAMEGKASAITRAVQWLVKRERERSNREQQKARKHRSVETSFSFEPANAVPALQVLGIVGLNEELRKHDPDLNWYLLEPWAVQAALDRPHRQGAYSSEAISKIQRMTRDASQLQWPKGRGHE